EPRSSCLPYSCHDFDHILPTNQRRKYPCQFNQLNGTKLFHAHYTRTTSTRDHTARDSWCRKRARDIHPVGSDVDFDSDKRSYSSASDWIYFYHSQQPDVSLWRQTGGERSNKRPLCSQPGYSCLGSHRPKEVPTLLIRERIPNARG